MPRYAQFDHTAASPAPVVGWYDTDALDYPSLPDAADLFVMTDDQWDGRLDGQWAIDNGALVSYTPPVPPPTADQVYQQKLADGIAITSTGTPALNATYPLDVGSVALVGSIARDASSGLGLPNDLPTVPIKDSDDNPHDFSEAAVIALYKAERNLVANLGTQRDVMEGGGTPVWPPQTATIP